MKNITPMLLDTKSKISARKVVTFLAFKFNTVVKISALRYRLVVPTVC